jgi:hypothetical protein
VKNPQQHFHPDSLEWIGVEIALILVLRQKLLYSKNFKQNLQLLLEKPFEPTVLWGFFKKH